MGVDEDLISIILEIIKFLESLSGISLPLEIENARIILLERSKKKLLTIGSSSIDSSSRVSYLDMTIGSKDSLLSTKMKNRFIEIEEYMVVEETTDDSEKSTQLDHYEIFQNDETIDAATDSTEKSESRQEPPDRDEQIHNRLIEIYGKFTAEETKSTAEKCGPIWYKVERKPLNFVSSNIRFCWIGLVGSYLLIHRSESDKQPPEIHSIRGYSARPAPGSVSKNPERAKSAFEIFCPGNKTLQFVARSPKEMEEWLEAISHRSASTQRDGKAMSKKDDILTERLEEPELELEEQKNYQDVGEMISSLSIKDSSLPSSISDLSLEDNRKKSVTMRKFETLPSATAPICPPRLISRCLPSLPSQGIVGDFYEARHDGENNDIYCHIEDYCKSERTYENAAVITRNGKIIMHNREVKREQEISRAETYDDVASSMRKNEENGEIYDDARSIVREMQISRIIDENSTSPRRNRLEISNESMESLMNRSFKSCEDNPLDASLSSNISDSLGRTKAFESEDSKKTIFEKDTTRTDESPLKFEKISKESSNKRSFLDRIGLKNNSRKEDTRKSSKNQSPESKKRAQFYVAELDSQTYDDVSGSTQTANQIVNYDFLPPTKSIYSKPRSPVNAETACMNYKKKLLADQVYDDIGNCLEKAEVKIISSHENQGSMSILMRKIDSKDAEDETIEKMDNNVGNVSAVGASREFTVVDENKKIMPFEPAQHQPLRIDPAPLNLSADAGDEQLYDDVPAGADFCAGSQNSSSSFDGAKKSIDPNPMNDKKRWRRRFGSFRKLASLYTSSRKNKLMLDFDNVDVNNLLSVAEKPARPSNPTI